MDSKEHKDSLSEDPKGEETQELPGESPAETQEDVAEVVAESSVAEPAVEETAAAEEEDTEPAGEDEAPAGDESGEESAAEAGKAKKAEETDKTDEIDKVEGDDKEGEDENKLPMKWYVIHTYSGHENKVKENILKMVKASSIEEQFGRLIVPTEEVAEMKKGKKTITTRKFFPSYILIEMFISDESWHLVNSIPGVTSFVGTGSKPQALSESEVERILGRMDKDRETIIPDIPFTLGEHIRIKDGPFSDFSGVVDEINLEKGKLRVLVSIFGRETPVELDFLQVESL